MIADPERIREPVRAELARGENELVLSAASAWETAIKHRLGKLTTPEPLESVIPALMQRSATQPLVVTHAHALRVASLPSHHRDPFDRLLVAQAQLEALPVLTSLSGTPALPA